MSSDLSEYAGTNVIRYLVVGYLVLSLISGLLVLPFLYLFWALPRQRSEGGLSTGVAFSCFYRSRVSVLR